ncbi:hypothetical protein [Gordonia sputi]
MLAPDRSARGTSRGFIAKIALVVVATVVVAFALYWGFVRDNTPSDQQGIRVESSFSATPNGPAPQKFDTGQSATTSNSSSVAEDHLRIVDHSLTFTPISAERTAGYFSTPNMQAPVTALGADFVFRPGDSSDGAVAFVISRNITRTAPFLVSPFPMHLVLTPVNWNVSVKNDDVGSPLQVIHAELYRHRLKTDGSTVYSVRVHIDGSSLTIELPDGTKKVLNDARISQWRGQFATFEVYANQGATAANGGFRKIWAESGEH